VGNKQTQTFIYDGLDRLMSGQTSEVSGCKYTYQDFLPQGTIVNKINNMISLEVTGDKP